MWKKWKESEFFRKMKQVRVNRAIYLSAIVILLSLAVVLAITAATNRAKRGPAGDESTPAVTEPATPPSTDTGDASRPTVKDETPPELALPTAGKLAERHSVDVQVFSDTMQDWRVHLGIDISTEAGAQVFAAADGQVSQIWEDPMMGTCIALTHTGDCVTVYKNLAREVAAGIEVGGEVQAGQLIGAVGDTAVLELAEEPHLHMEMTVKGLQVDPLDYFSTAVLKTLSEDTIYEDGINGK
jgi:murein DD-endopeptidase MepM/ murein hydrolase activator NlpD